MGVETEEKVFSTFNQCKLESEQICKLLVKYHQDNQKGLKINLDKKTISNGKVIEFFAEFLHKEEWKERQIPEGVATTFAEQMKPFEMQKALSMSKYDEDVVLISKEGELYYLPSSEIAEN